MANLSGIVTQLKKERDQVQKQLSAIDAAISAFVNVYGKTPIGTSNGKRAVSAAARRRMSLSQKARWAQSSTKHQTAKPKRGRSMSAAARRKIAAAQRARWAKIKAKKAA